MMNGKPWMEGERVYAVSGKWSNSGLNLCPHPGRWKFGPGCILGIEFHAKYPATVRRTTGSFLYLEWDCGCKGPARFVHQLGGAPLRRSKRWPCCSEAAPNGNCNCPHAPCLHDGLGMCGYSNCFRQAVMRRGFMPVCQVHLAQPRKWGKDGKTFTGSVFVKEASR
jgi:hypothetical protein